MNCQDVREGISGETGLTEWALVHAHLMQCAECRKEREQRRQEASSRPGLPPSRALLQHLRLPGFAARLTRLRALLSISLTVSGPAAARVVGTGRAELARVLGLPARVRRLPILLAPPLRVAAASVGRARFAFTRGVDPVIGLGSSSVVVLRRVVRSAAEAARAGGASSTVALQRTTWSALKATRVGGTRAFEWLPRLRVRSAIAFTGITATAARGRLIAASRVGTTRILDVLIRARRMPAALFALPGRAVVRAIAATRAAGRIVVTTARRARPFLKVGTAVASLAVLVAATMFFLPRQWPDDLIPRFSASRQPSPEARRPVDPEPAARATAPPPAKTSSPAPAALSRQEAAPAVMRSRPPEAAAGAPAAPRRPDPALVRAAAPTEGTETAEAPDPSAAIDWLLKGGSGRGR
jgi:hypothetical protein